MEGGSGNLRAPLVSSTGGAAAAASLATSIVLLMVMGALVDAGLSSYALYIVFTEKSEGETFLWTWLLVYGVLGVWGLLDKVHGITAGKSKAQSAASNAGGTWVFVGFIGILVVTPTNLVIFNAVKWIMIIMVIAIVVMCCVVLCVIGSAVAVGVSAIEHAHEANLKKLPEPIVSETSMGDCSLCMKQMNPGEKVISLSCGNETHSNHAECMRNRVSTTGSCPRCNRKLE